MPSSQRCPECYLPAQVCLCAEITRIPCGVEIVVLRHVMERRRNSNTGRLVARALEGAKVLEYALREEPLDTAVLAGANTALLYPRPSSVDAPQPTRLILLDASWSQARRMAQRIPELRSMPSLSLPTPIRVLPRMREGKAPEQMSTAESAIAALRLLGEVAAADHLEVLLRELVRRFALPKRRGPM
ncbi:MAG: DTW domain-containing protein [Myxococcales bacterium]|nr:DTW domain-containing protein [Myxococcales bacterium]